MKKIILSVLFVAMMAVYAQAQLFVGGSIGADYTAYKYTFGSTTEKGDALFAFEFNPMLGFDLSDRMGIGATLNLGMFTVSDREDPPFKLKALMYGVSPFVRNAVLYSGNLSLLLETKVSFLGVNTKSSYESQTVDGPKILSYGLSVAPVLSYSLTDRLFLEARVNLFRLSIGQAVIKDVDDDKDISTFFGIGINPSAITSPLLNEMEIPVMSASPIEIGMVFRF